ncbi:amino acid adenylation domain-containing protein [Caenimonas terrae]|uniref:Amino acid adenylation domain-containing protein n=1 Tax=Caenimonas terrae TaxID=696074 RepID=A0ABW0NDS5_9BURK
MSDVLASGFPLSPWQQRLWQLGARDGLNAYRVELEFEADASVDPAALCAALARVAQRHEILRTAFGLLPGMQLPVQSPLPSAPPVLLDGADAQAEPGRIVLRQLGAHRYHLVLSALAADAQTALRVLQLADEDLRGAAAGADVHEALPFSSLAQWQQDTLDEAAGSKPSPWPQHRPAALPFLLRMPAAGTRPARHALDLPAALQSALASTAAELGADLSDLLLAAWSALLLRLDGEPVALALVADGRSYDELAQLPGPFARLAPLPLHPDAAQPFGALVAAVARAAADTQSMQDQVPPLPLQAHAGLAFAWAEAPSTASPLLKPLAPFAWIDRCLLQLSAFRDSQGRIALHFDHDAWSCDTSALHRLEEEYLTLLQSIAGAPQQPLSSLAILGPQERALVLEGMQGASLPSALPWRAVNMQLHDALLSATGRTVIDQADIRLDGPALATRIDSIAAQLVHAGARPGAVVALLLPRGIDMVAGLLAIQRAGAAYLPLDTSYPDQRLAFMVQDSGAGLLLTCEPLAGELGGKPAFAALLAQLQVLAVDGAQAACATPRPAFPEPGPTDLACLIYTSGSSGRPKGVRVPHGALANHMAWMLRELPLLPDDAVLQKTAVSFDASVWEIFAPLMAGARLVLAPPGAERDPDALAAAIQRHTVTVLQVVPSLLRLLVENARFRACRSLRRLCCGGEALDAALAGSALALGVELVNLYGPTETTIEVIAGRVGAGDPVVAIGKPIDNTRIYILDGQGRPQPVGVRGEIHIAGAPLAQGYHGRPELTAQRFVADPFAAAPGQRMYRSGDAGAWRADGSIDFFGRADRQVKLRGYRVELGEIEAVAAAYPGVALAAAVVDRDAAGIDQLLCFYSLHPGRSVDAAQFKRALAAALPEPMTPNWLVQVESFPTTPSGKVDAAALLRLRPAMARATKGPRDTLEMRLERIWESVLGIGHAGIDSGFFDLGGHSLLAVRLMAEIEKEFGHRLPLTSLFAAPTIAAQAQLLRGEAIRTDPIVVPIRTGKARRSPIVFVHPTGGSVLCYRDIASALRTERPIVALQDPGLSGPACYESVEELAANYLDRLEPLVPDRRYLLAGWSSGGVIAYEIARQALARGHEVALLCLIDSRATDGSAPAPQRDRLLRSISRLIAHKADLSCPDLSGLPYDDALQGLLQLARKADFVPADTGRSDIEKLYQVFERNVTVIGRYQAGPLPRRTLIMKATELLPEGIREAAAHPLADGAPLGWERLCFANVHHVAADHMSIMEPPRLAGVLAALDSELEEIERLDGLPRHNLLPMLGM